MPPLSSGSGGWCIDINMKKFLFILEALQLIVGRLSRIKVFFHIDISMQLQFIVAKTFSNTTSLYVYHVPLN